MKEIIEIASRCSDMVTPSLSENYEYLLETINQSTTLKKRLIVLGPANPDKLRVSIALWNLFFPDHCRGDTVFFAGVARSAFDTYTPAVLVSCKHFEHGNEYPDLENLSILAKVVTQEAFGIIRRYWYEIIVLHPYAEKLVMAIYPEMPEESEQTDMRKVIRETIRHRLVRIDKDVPLDAVPRILGE